MVDQVQPQSQAAAANSSSNVDNNWKTDKTFYADTSTWEKVCRVANVVVFGAAIFGAYSICIGTAGLLAYGAMILAARKIIAVIIGSLAHPAALLSTIGGISKKELQKVGNWQLEILQADGYIVNKKYFYKSGIRYEAVLIGHKDTIDNGKWTIPALGNMMYMQNHFYDYAKENNIYGSNVLLINGAAVVGSGGWPTRYQMAAGYEAALQFLEKRVSNISHIRMYGLSLGGGVKAEAILQHDFSAGLKKGIKYSAFSDRTFDTLSNVAAKLIGFFVRPLFYFSGAELDGISAAEKLTKLKISHRIIQHNSIDARGSDHVIPDRASLANALERGVDNRVFIESEEIGHNGPLPKDVQAILDQEIQNFFS